MRTCTGDPVASAVLSVSKCAKSPGPLRHMPGRAGSGSAQRHASNLRQLTRRCDQERARARLQEFGREARGQPRTESRLRRGDHQQIGSYALDGCEDLVTGVAAIADATPRVTYAVLGQMTVDRADPPVVPIAKIHDFNPGRRRL